MNKTALAALLAVTFALPAAAADTYKIDRAHSEATFQVRHFVSKVRGRFQEFDGTFALDRQNPGASQAEFTIKTTSIDTDNDQRDNHLRSADFFDAEKFPVISFKSTKIVASGKDAYQVTGPLTMHGVTKEVTLPVTFLGFANGDAKAGFEITTTLNRKDYGVIWNKALDQGAMMLGDDVAITINIEANRQDPVAAPKK